MFPPYDVLDISFAMEVTLRHRLPKPERRLYVTLKAGILTPRNMLESRANLDYVFYKSSSSLYSGTTLRRTLSRQRLAT